MEIELSVIIPCLNEAETLETCINKAKKACLESNISYEIIICDNGSTDGSKEIALNSGANLINVKNRGYGYALQAGIDKAKGYFIIMGDADDSYDFLEIPRFIDKLKNGYDLVIGCRLPIGGGVLKKGSMPFLHRWIGNPIFSFLSRVLFKVPINDIYCGLRGFNSEKIRKINIVSRGMEFAVEMMIKSAFNNFKISEIPITYHPDGRVNQKSHLKTFRDGFRTLRLLFIYSPNFIFKYPGYLIFSLGIILSFIAILGLKFSTITFDVHTYMLSALMIIIGHQFLIFSSCSDVFASQEGFKLLSNNKTMDQSHDDNSFFSITLSIGLISLGITATIVTFFIWRNNNYGSLNYPYTMRIVITGVLFLTLGIQQLLYTFFRSLLEIKRHSN